MEWSNLAVQIPVVVAFALFAMAVIKVFNGWMEKRDASWQTFLKEQDITDKAFLKEHREAYLSAFTTAMTQVGGDVRDIGDKVDGIAGKIDKHTELLREHDKKLEMAVNEMKIKTSK